MIPNRAPNCRPPWKPLTSSDYSTVTCWRPFSRCSPLSTRGKVNPINALWSDVLTTDGSLLNDRYEELEFKMKEDGVVHGFAGFFHCVLYKDVTMSTWRATHGGIDRQLPLSLQASIPTGTPPTCSPGSRSSSRSLSQSKSRRTRIWSSTFGGWATRRPSGTSGRARSPTPQPSTTRMADLIPCRSCRNEDNLFDIHFHYWFRVYFIGRLFNFAVEFGLVEHFHWSFPMFYG